MASVQDESKNQQIREFLKNNPQYLRGYVNYKHVADKFETTTSSIEHICRRFRKKHPELDPLNNQNGQEETAGKGNTSYGEKGDKAEYTFNTVKQIKTKEELIEACDIDLTYWDIERWICNKWEVGAKNSDNVIVVTPLFQIKLWLKPKLNKIDTDVIREIIEEFVTVGSPVIIPQTPNLVKAIKATVTDMHVGLDPDPGGLGLFEYEYNAEIFNNNLDKVYASIIKEFNTHGKFDLLIIDDLGDALDGFNGQTVRGGHSLDQNMDNVQSFKTFVTGKLRLIENCIKAEVANRILIRNISNDNHSGDFSHIANMTIQMILERSYDKSCVEFYILTKFMEHFRYGNHTFILTHGKDKKHMFRGLPLDLNDKTITFINDYIDHYNINTPYIHLEKGDLHQIGYKRAKKFDYRNFMSFAPPSAHVQHNYGISYAGYSVQVVPKYVNEISHTDYFFDFKKIITG